MQTGAKHSMAFRPAKCSRDRSIWPDKFFTCIRPIIYTFKCGIEMLDLTLVSNACHSPNQNEINTRLVARQTFRGDDALTRAPTVAFLQTHLAQVSRSLLKGCCASKNCHAEGEGAKGRESRTEDWVEQKGCSKNSLQYHLTSTSNHPIQTYTWNNISSSQVFGPHPLQQPALKDFKVSNVSWGAVLFTGVASEFYFSTGSGSPFK